jgi:hypothetical protein
MSAKDGLGSAVALTRGHLPFPPPLTMSAAAAAALILPRADDDDDDVHSCPHLCKCSSAHGYQFRSSSIKTHTESFGQHPACNDACTQHLLATVDEWCPKERQQVIPSVAECLALAEAEDIKLTKQLRDQKALVSRKDEQRAKRKREDGVIVDEERDYGAIERIETLKDRLELAKENKTHFKRQKQLAAAAGEDIDKTEVRTVRLNTLVSLCPAARIARVFGAERSTVSADRLAQLTRLMREIHKAPYWKAELKRNWTWKPIAAAIAHTDSDMSFEELVNLARTLPDTYMLPLDGLKDAARSLPADAFHRQRARAFLLALAAGNELA